jgi:hypothetical protein
MKMRDGGGVPGVAGQGACTEAARVVDETSDDHFDDVLGNPCDKIQMCRRSVRRSTSRAHPLDSGQTSKPNSLGEQLDRCGGKQQDAVIRKSTKW